MKVEFFKHNIGAKGKNKLMECLDGIFLTSGEYVAELEHKFAEYLGTEYCVGLNSCTAALHLSLLALGVGDGDEVITTPMTFIATATAIIHTGAKPVFADVEPDSALIDPRNIERAITDRTKAIVPVHLYGQMCDMNKIREIAEKYGLRIVEDAAHCIEGERDGVRPGQLSDVACFSFYATKNITSGEGGAIATNDRELAEKVRLLRQHGMSKEAADRYSGFYQHWDMIECGWKYNMSNIQAALLLPQLQNIDQTWLERKRIYEAYLAEFKLVPQIKVPQIASDSKSAYHLFTIWIDKTKRDEMIGKFGENEIGVAVNYRAIHLLSYLRQRYGFRKEDFSIAQEIGESTITLPLYPKLKDDEVEYVIETTKKIVASV